MPFIDEGTVPKQVTHRTRQEEALVTCVVSEKVCDSQLEIEAAPTAVV
jgi:hypothetical protein